MSRMRHLVAGSPGLFPEDVRPLAAHVASFAPTPEQLAIVDASDSGTLAAKAFAGAAKTSTLVLVAKRASQARRRSLYLAFNRAIAEEASRKFLRTATCKTTHSLAFGAMARHYGAGDKMTGSLSPFALAQAIALPSSATLGGAVSVNSTRLAVAVRACVTAFCYSADATLAPHHVELPEVASLWTEAQRARYAAVVFSYADTLWKAAISPHSAVPLGHDGYLKLWAMGQPTFPADLVMLDEAQDSNPVLLDALQRSGVPVIYVGDPHQQIYSFRRAINAMASVSDERSFRLSRSFRFGAAIAALANRLLALLGERHPLVGAGGDGEVKVEGYPEAIDGPHAVLCRTNASLIVELFDADRQQRPVHIIGGTAELLRLIDDAAMLQAGVGPVSGPFFGFNQWSEVVEFVEEHGGELRPFVRIIEAHGIPMIRDALHRVKPTESDATCVLATGHKSKGREWDVVRLAEDFRLLRAPADHEPQPADDEEVRLLYVAATRARRKLLLPATLLRDLETREGMALNDGDPLHQGAAC